MEIRCKIQGVLIRNSVTMNRVGIGWKVGERFEREGAYVYLCLIHVMYDPPVKNKIEFKKEIIFTGTWHHFNSRSLI